VNRTLNFPQYLTTRVLPAEWVRQTGVMLVWPHEQTDWADQLEAVEKTYFDIAREIARRETVLIVCCDEDQRAWIHDRLRLEGIDPAAVRFAIGPFNDTWIRDYGPLTVFDEGRPKLLDFRFNAWGGKYPASLDDALNCALHDQGTFGNVPMEAVSLVLEGGSIDTDGAGSLLTTSRCLLAPSRNHGLDRRALESRLKRLLGIERVLCLEHGCLAGDDTDSHIDMLARFCDADTIAYTACEHPNDEHYEPLRAMEAELQSFRTRSGKPYRLIALPLPTAVYHAKGQRLPASYSNFLIINGAVLLPTYNDSADQTAVERLQETFLDCDIVSVDCTSLIQQYGSLHCMTMQLPEGITICDASRISPARQQR
jgi:agmatine deiminase